MSPLGQTVRGQTIIDFILLDFKLQPCSEFFFLSLGNSPVSEFYMPTFRNTLSVPSL